jgi:UPF0755 protein
VKSPREALQPDMAPPPPPPPQRRRRLSLVSLISGVLSFVIVAMVVLVIGWSFAIKKVTAPGPLTADKTVNIVRGDDVAQTLEEQGVIENALLLKLTLLAEGDKDKVKFGEYLFKQGASLRQVIDTLISGKQVLHALTIPEGLTSLQVVDRIRENDILLGDVKNIPPEGSLMPDTYKFARGTTRDQLIRTMQQESKKVVSEVWGHHDPETPIRSPQEMVTLASIVEKETGKPDERPRVAGVFINRLSKNIPLQSDPTIVYGIVGGKGTLGRGILKSEVEQKTPYNTYAIVGLPPGPIANPGKAALEAVANPAKTKELYFVADGTGGHAFSETLDQHRQNVQRWRQIEKDAKDKVTPDADKSGQPLPAGTAVPKPNQRGDAGAPANFGALGTFAAIHAAANTSRLGTFPMTLPQTDSADAPAPGKPLAYSSTSFDQLNVHVDGVDDDEGAEVAAAADAANTASAGSLLTFPLSPSRQTEMNARAARFGLPPAPTGPKQAALDPDQQPQPASNTPVPNPANKGKIFDASEGTALDPLLDKSYDLNSAKSVPVLKALPPVLSSYR